MKEDLDKTKPEGFLGCYKDLIRTFLANGYTTQFFTPKVEAMGRLLLRHDVDFDCSFAADIAAVEESLEVRSTFFFLLRSDSYNLLSKRNAQIVREIKDRGHEISLHFDPVLYGPDFLKGFYLEKEIFQNTFDTQIRVISIHRPNEFFLKLDESLGDVDHTYQRKYFGDIKYISDSQGNFRFGHPLESVEFKDRKTIHLLIHPIWWQVPGESNMMVLRNHITRQHELLHQHVGDNCIPFREYLSKNEKDWSIRLQDNN